MNPPDSAAWQYCLEAAQRRRLEQQEPDAQRSIGSAFARSIPESSPVEHELLDLYAPLLSLRPGQPFAIGHLAQGIDGNIATDSGSSRGLSGEENHRHLHRLRALADVVIIGSMTAQLDDPLLTVRLVSGPNPARLVIDPSVRLPVHLRMFNDGAAPSMIVCARENRSLAISRWGADRVMDVDVHTGLLDLNQLQSQLQERGWPVVLVEGGGVTVSRMLEAGCLNRVQISVSPVMIGGGRRGLQLASLAAIDESPRPPARIFQMGEDLVWDLDLRGDTAGARRRSDTSFKRII